VKPFLLSIAILMVAVPVAYAARFTGLTSQDRAATVVTEDGAPVRITIRWRAPCGHGRLRHYTHFAPPFDESTSTFVRDGGPYVTDIKDTEGRTYRFHARARVRARQVTENKWRGRFKVSGELRRNGELETRCESPRIRWRATR
jgi:hypothetical protein